jgi:hypothetical protein
VGQALVVTTLLAITGAIIESSRDAGNAALIGSAGLAAAAALIRYERRREQPLLEPSLFRSVPFSGALVAAIAAFVALSGFLFLNTLYLQDVRGYNALQAGLLTLPMAGATVLTAPISGRVTARYGARAPLIAAGGLIAAAALTLISVTPATPLPVLLLGYVLFGAGIGVVNTPITSTAVTGLPPARAGVSAALASTGRQVGNTLGVAILGSIVAAHAPGGFTAAGHVGWLIMAGCGTLIATLGVLTTTSRAAASAAHVAPAHRSAPLPSAADPRGSTTGFVGRPRGAREGMLDLAPVHRRSGHVDGAVAGQAVEEGRDQAGGQPLPAGVVRQWPGDQRAEHDDVGGVDRRPDASFQASPRDESLQAPVDGLPRLGGLRTDQRWRPVQGQHELVADGQRAGEELADRVQSGQFEGLDLGEDIAQEAVGAQLQGVDQGVPVGEAAVERGDADPGEAGDRRHGHVVALAQRDRGGRGEQPFPVLLGVPPDSPWAIRPIGVRSGLHCLPPDGRKTLGSPYP